MATKWSVDDEISAVKLNENRGFFDVAARAYGSSIQFINDSNGFQNYRIAIFEAESYDEGSDFDSRLLSGVADATESYRLHDADGGFSADLVGAIVWNTTDGTVSKVVTFVDSGELLLNDPIMASGESYKIYFSKFTAPDDGIYLINTTIGWLNSVDQSKHKINVRKNGTTSIASQENSSSGSGGFIQAISTIAKLNAGDYIQIRVYQYTGSIINLMSSSGKFLEVIRIA